MALAVAASIPGPMVAQGVSPAPTGQILFWLDLPGTPVGEIPTAIKQLKGIMEVVIKDGAPMLKASAASEFLIPLPQVLPPDFTLEFDIVPKGCCNPQDLSFEGTPTIDQGSGSAHVLWDSDGYLNVIGGGTTYEAPVPEDLRTTLPGVLTRVVATVQGSMLKLYTNGKRHYTLDRQFARGRVLRVFLGGQDDGGNAVYLAGLRVTAGAASPASIAVNTSALSGSTLASAPMGTLTAVTGSTPPPGTPVGVPVATPANVPTGPGVSSGAIPARKPAPPTIPTTTSQSQASTGGSVPTTVANVSVVQGMAGPVVSWQPVSVPAAYSVRRWKIDDLNCCNSASLAGSPLAGPPWQDAPPPVPGTYVYEVTATVSGGTATGQAQFVHFGSGGQIAAVAPTGTPTGAPARPIVPAPTSPAVPMVNPPSVPAAASGPTAGTLPLTLSVTAAPAPWPDVGHVRVTWTKSPLAQSYSIRRWKSDDLNCCNQSSGFLGPTVLNWQVDGGLPGTYVYEVTATTSNGTIIGQTQYIVPVLAPPPPTRGSITPANWGPPPWIGNVTGTPSQTHLTWALNIMQPPGVTYTVQRWLASDPTCCGTQVTGLTATQWTDEGVQWSGTYIYRVTANYPDGRAGAVDHTWVRPDPVNPSNFRTAVLSAGSVTLMWDPVANASWYELTGPGVPYGSFQITPPQKHFTIRGLAPGTYTWRIGTFYTSPNAPAAVSSPVAAFPQITVAVP